MTNLCEFSQKISVLYDNVETSTAEYLLSAVVNCAICKTEIIEQFN